MRCQILDRSLQTRGAFSGSDTLRRSRRLAQFGVGMALQSSPRSRLRCRGGWRRFRQSLATARSGWGLTLRRRWRCRRTMEHGMVMPGVPLRVQTGGQQKHDNHDSRNSCERRNHRLVTDIQPHSILGQRQPNWEVDLRSPLWHFRGNLAARVSCCAVAVAS